MAKRHIFVADSKSGRNSGKRDMMRMDEFERPVLIKRYAGRRLYRPATSTYLTRDDLITMAKADKEFVVIDADTQDDVTHYYHPIIVEQRKT
jgi:polyhydroxyalkanoate synthesis regulator protein